MTQREKMLAGLVAVTGLAYFGNEGLTKYRAAAEQAENKQFAAQEQLETAKIELYRAERARDQLHECRQRSLPTNPDVARSLYQDWLSKLAKEAKLEKVRVDDKTNARSFDSESKQLTYAVSGQAKLSQVTELLYKFYESGYLHRISKATLTPTEKGDKLDVQLTINALILPGCRRQDTLAKDSQVQLASSLEYLRKQLVDRNIFAMGKTTQKTANKNNGDDKLAKESILSGTLYGLGGWYATIRQKQGDKLLRLSADDELEIGRIKGLVLEVDGRGLTYQTDKGRFVVRLGDSFADAEDLGKSEEQSVEANDSPSSQESTANETAAKQESPASTDG